jgi:hypothetical protein
MFNHHTISTYGGAEVQLYAFSTQKYRLNFREIQDVTFQKTELFITTGVGTSKILQNSVLISNIPHACYVSLYQNVSLKLYQSDDYHSCLLQRERQQQGADLTQTQRVAELLAAILEFILLD